MRRLYDYLPQYKNPRYFNLMLDFYRPTLGQVDDPHYAMAVRWANGKALEACFSRDVQEIAGVVHRIVKETSGLVVFALEPARPECRRHWRRGWRAASGW